jgi:NitT/TauT family transport system substrate-binding protein
MTVPWARRSGSFWTGRIWTRGLLFLAAFLISAGAWAQEKAEKMNVGYSAQAGAFAPVWITKEAGLFRKYGLDVNLIFIPGGPTAAAAMLAGEVQAVAMAGPAIITSNLAGSDLVMIAGIVNTFAFQIITVKGITEPAQLKGKRIGINRFGAAPDIAARYALGRLGIDPKDVTLLQLGEQSTRLAAMKSGQLDAAVVLPPITTMAEKAGMNVLLDMSELGAEFQITGLASSRTFTKQRRPSALRLMRAFVDGIHYYKTHKPESMRIIARMMRTDDMEAVGATYDYFATKIVPKKPYPTLKGVKALLDLAAKERPEAAKLSPERFVDVSLLKELDDSGFIDRLYQ